MDRAYAEGQIRVQNAVRVEIVAIKHRQVDRALGRGPQVQVRWTVLNEEPEFKWLSVGETLLSHVDVDINPEV